MDNEWVKNLTRISVQAMQEKGLCDIFYGTVLSVSPLQVQLDQKTVLREKQVILTARVRDRVEKMAIPGLGEVDVKVSGALKPGEKVILLQAVGGQRFVALDRY